MTTTLITGANKGLGREVARRLVLAGHDVWLAGRDEAGVARAAEEVGGRPVVLDVTDDASVAAAAALVADAGGLDVLVNNAGIAGTYLRPEETDPAQLAVILETNVVGVARVTQAFLPALRASEEAHVVNVSSSLGSMANSAAADAPENVAYLEVAYCSSKAALNMLTLKYAHALAPRVRVNAVNPGYTATDLNGFQGTQTTEEGAEPIVALALQQPGGATATFSQAEGALPW